ncbi:hypothetical protein QVD99_008315 [Batrachochytrium dendrobatidis]|nr:hypothetical protein O5D80_007189 [Batrachochytrium dendrobatidis]KAK5664770.1 hypothetical protein QVD99_008315 [Batrachochytrium dendrobatidis]
MRVCQHFLRGNCKFGSKCHNEHPMSNQAPSQFSKNNSPNASHTSTLSNSTSYPLELKSLKTDLQSEKPIWPLSVYGHAKHQVSIISGTDISQEEARLIFDDELKQNGNLAGYLNKVNEACTNMQNQINQCLSSPSAANEIFKQRTRANQSTGSVSGNNSSLFGASRFGSLPSQTQTQSSFGSGISTGNSFSALANSTKSIASSPFSQSTSSQSVFGQSSFGQAPTAGNSVFGQSSFGQAPAAGNSVFGQSSFGKTPAAGNSVFGQSSFGQQPTTSSVFGQSSFGQAPAAGNSVFGQPFTNTQSSFNQPIFDQQPATGQPVFGQSFAPSQSNPSNGSVFGQPQSTMNAFGGNQFEQSQNSIEPTTKPLASSGIFGQSTASMFSDVVITPTGPTTETQNMDPQILSAFTNAAFEFGKIPEIEPPPQFR